MNPRKNNSEFTARRHPQGIPKVAELLQVLARNEVRFVLVGSVAAATYGAEVRPGDLDIAPECSHANISNLVLSLREIEAQPLGPFGEWQDSESGEKKWKSRPTTEEELAAWVPDVTNLDTLDQLYVTKLGNFDVVPKLAGSYDELRPRASLNSYEGHDVWVAHIDDILTRLTVPRREKDRARVEQLREIQRRGERPS